MSDIPVYMVVNLHVKDASEYRVYEKGFFPILKKYGGTFITYDDNTETLEGDPRKGRMIIFSFPSEKKAKDWYADEEYQALSKHRWAGTETRFLTMIHGLPPRA
jgi:uncharacterized protein (DUF1330 family)|tara:strand:+ start:765 stop:1076 length:312 start_codon:yes stop_codon:yes gene_type:complete